MKCRMNVFLVHKLTYDRVPRVKAMSVKGRSYNLADHDEANHKEICSHFLVRFYTTTFSETKKKL